MKYQFLGSYITAVSDTYLALGALLFFGSIVGSWYVWGLCPLHQEMSIQRQHTMQLQKRIALLQKRMQHAHLIKQKLSDLHQSFTRQNLPFTIAEALGSCMRAIHRNNLQFIQYKNEPPREYRYVVEQMVVCELLGSYEDLYAFLSSESVRCGECTITQRSEGLLLSGTFGVYAGACKESSPKESR